NDSGSTILAAAVATEAREANAATTATAPETIAAGAAETTAATAIVCTVPAAVAADRRVVAEGHIHEGDAGGNVLTGIKTAAAVGAGDEQAAAQAAAAAAAGVAALRRHVLQRQVLDRDDAGIDEESAVGIGAVDGLGLRDAAA